MDCAALHSWFTLFIEERKCTQKKKTPITGLSAIQAENTIYKTEIYNYINKTSGFASAFLA